MPSEIDQIFVQFCEYSVVFKGNSPGTIRWLKFNFNSFIKFSRIETVDQIDKRGVERWIINQKLQRGWSPKSVRSGLQVMSIFLKWCVQEGLVANNFVKDIPWPKLPKQLPKALSLDKAERLILWVQNYPYAYQFNRARALAIIGLFLYTGIRREELRQLQIQDVNLKDNQLFIRSGKGDKDRLIPINLRLKIWLEAYEQERKRLQRKCPYYFTVLRADEQLSVTTINRLVKSLREASGIHFYPHMLRHTFATLMLEGGCDLFSLSKMMGHSDIKTTTIYLGATTKHLKEQVSKHPLG